MCMKRPHVIINCAMSVDGKIASPSGKQLRISCEEDIQRMYELRNASDAVLVGINTILSDNPKLTVKETYAKQPRNPLRIVLDTYCRTPLDSLVVNDSAKTLIVVGSTCAKQYGSNVEVMVCKKTEEGLIDLESLLDILSQRGVRTLMVEGGSTVIWQFLQSNLVDDMFVYVAPMIIGGEHTPTLARGDSKDPLELSLVNVNKLGPGLLLHYRLIS